MSDGSYYTPELRRFLSGYEPTAWRELVTRPCNQTPNRAKPFTITKRPDTPFAKAGGVIRGLSRKSDERLATVRGPIR